MADNDKDTVYNEEAETFATSGPAYKRRRRIGYAICVYLALTARVIITLVTLVLPLLLDLSNLLSHPLTQRTSAICAESARQGETSPRQASLFNVSAFSIC
jgi:hypothetical protein